MDKVLEAFRNCITDRKCENRDCPYESRCQIANGKDQYLQIPKHLAFDVARILSYLLKEDDGWNPITEDAENSRCGTVSRKEKVAPGL